MPPTKPSQSLGRFNKRKYVSQDEWHIIYPHILPYLRHPNRERIGPKLKSTIRNIELIVRGTPLPWDAAWRRMRRCMDHSRPEEPKHPLPDHIVIRIQTSEPSTHYHSSGGVATTIAPRSRCRHGSVKLRPSYEDDSWSFVGLPMETVIQYTIGLAWSIIPPETRAQGSHLDVNPTRPSIMLPYSLYPGISGASEDFRSTPTHGMLSAVVGNPSTDLTTFTNYNESYVSLFTIIYLLSNSLVENETMEPHEHQQGLFSELFRKLDVVFAAIPGKYLEGLLSRLVRFRFKAAFQNFIMLSGIYEQPQTFDFLVKFGAAHAPNQLVVPGKEQDLLIFAVSMNLTGALRTLLQNRCFPDSYTDKCQSGWTETAIVKALKSRNTQYAQLLLKHCNVNKRIGYCKATERTNFDCFLLSLHGCEKSFELGMVLFLSAGANVDGHSPQSRPYYPEMRSSELRQQNFINRKHDIELNFSVLDYLFYFHRSLFHQFSNRSAQAQRGSLSRTGVLLALEGGTQNLAIYLDELGEEIHQERRHRLLQQLIAEQFLIHDFRGQKRATNLDTVRALLGFGTSFKEVLNLFPHILQDFTALVGANCSENEVHAGQYLIQHGATVNFETLSWSARLPATLQFDFAQLEDRFEHRKTLEWALVDAAASNHFAAVERLIHLGANLDSDIILHVELGYQQRSFRVGLIANVIYSWNANSSGLSEMLKFLVDKGAPLRLSARRTHLYQLLHITMEWLLPNGGQALLELARYIIVDAGYNPSLQNETFLSASLLESCCNMDLGVEIFEFLYEKEAQLRPGSPMATWIDLGGGIDLVRKMLQKGANLDAYTRRTGQDSDTMTALQVAAFNWRTDIVELLLQEGADINAPARGNRGLTALQASCYNIAASSSQQERKLRTVQLLLGHSPAADINAAPARVRGLTALQATAQCGDLAVASLLLPGGADVNAPPCKEMGFGNALDLAARKGRLDMVKFLLNWNAVSHDWGRSKTPTPYEGAECCAVFAGHFAVSDLINEHIKDAEKPICIINSFLSKPRGDAGEYRYESGSKEESGYPSDEIYSSDYSTSEDEEDEEDEGIPSATSQQDPSEASSTVFLGNTTEWPAQDDIPIPVPGGDPFEDPIYSPSFYLPLERWSGDSMDWRTSFNDEASVLQDTWSWNAEIDVMCDVFDGNGRIEEIGEDSE